MTEEGQTIRCDRYLQIAIIFGPQARWDPEIIHKHLKWVSDGMNTLLSPQISTDYSMKYGQAIASDLLTPNLSFLWILISSLATKMCGLSKYCKNTVKYCKNIVSLLAPSGALIAIPTYYWPTTTPPHPTFSDTHRSSTLDFHFLSHYSYIKAIMLYKGNHWTWYAGFMGATLVWLGNTNGDLGTSWALPGDNLGMTWGWLGHYFGKTWQDLRTPLDNFGTA